MSEPVKIKRTDFTTMIEDLKNKSKAAQEKLKDNGGMCIKCGNDPAEVHNPDATNFFNCKKCNAELDKLIEQASGPGFMHIKL